MIAWRALMIEASWVEILVPFIRLSAHSLLDND